MASEGLAEAFSCLDCCTVSVVHGLWAGQEMAPHTNAAEHGPQYMPWHSVSGVAEVLNTAVELSTSMAVLCPAEYAHQNKIQHLFVAG